jgi:hypothetical protein
MFNTIIFYDTKNSNYMTYDLDTKVLKEIEILPTNKQYFLLNKKYDSTQLEEYGELFIKEADELKKLKIVGVYKYDIFDTFYAGQHYYKNSDNLAINLIKRYTDFKTIESYDEILFPEWNIINNCYNGALRHYIPGEYKNVWSYDFIMFFPMIIGAKNSKFQISTKKGRNIKLKSLPEELEYG